MGIWRLTADTTAHRLKMLVGEVTGSYPYVEQSGWAYVEDAGRPDEKPEWMEKVAKLLADREIGHDVYYVG